MIYLCVSVNQMIDCKGGSKDKHFRYEIRITSKNEYVKDWKYLSKAVTHIRNNNLYKNGHLNIVTNEMLIH